MIYKNMINSILRRLREDQVNAVDENHYSRLVGQFINDAKRRVEDAWQWLAIQEYVTVTTTAGVSTYDLKDYTTAQGNLLCDRAKIVKKLDTGLPFALCTTTDNETFLDFADQQSLELQVVTDSNRSVRATPTCFYFTNNDTTEQDRVRMSINFYPIPDAEYSYRIYFTNPQKDLAVDSDYLKVPEDPVIQLAYLYCLYERGEEIGEMLTLTADKATASLADAISIDEAQQAKDLSFSNV